MLTQEHSFSTHKRCRSSWRDASTLAAPRPAAASCSHSAAPSAARAARACAVQRRHVLSEFSYPTTSHMLWQPWFSAVGMHGNCRPV